ncbi:MAG: hypothetical protein E6G14_12695 [Actinobacteria bacterium]|nr:MAG: hypothetical protein E6G14_12695 [Actinomycetota bacterium]
MIPPRLDELLRAIGPAGFEEEVAAMVSHVDGDGLLSLHKLGDLAPATLVDQRVDVRSRNGHVPDVGRPERRRGRGGHGRGSGTRGAGRSSRGVRPRARTRPGPHSLGSRA